MTSRIVKYLLYYVFASKIFLLTLLLLDFLCVGVWKCGITLDGNNPHSLVLPFDPWEMNETLVFHRTNMCSFIDTACFHNIHPRSRHQESWIKAAYQKYMNMQWQRRRCNVYFSRRTHTREELRDTEDSSMAELSLQLQPWIWCVLIEEPLVNLHSQPCCRYCAAAILNCASYFVVRHKILIPLFLHCEGRGLIKLVKRIRLHGTWRYLVPSSIVNSIGKSYFSFFFAVKTWHNCSVLTHGWTTKPGFFLNKIAKTQQDKNSRISKLKPKTQAESPKTQHTGTFT